MLYYLDLAGTLVFAISGGFRAVKHELDLLGVLVLAAATGIGGGLIRDVLLGATPAASLQDETYLVVCIIGGVLVFVAAPRLARQWQNLMVADAIGLGLFAAMGAAKGAAFGLGPIGVMLMAALTATGGGVVRDLLVLEIPSVISKGFYATAALAGGLCFIVLGWVGVPATVQLLATMGVTTGLRGYAILTNLRLPRAQRLPASPGEMHARGKRE